MSEIDETKICDNMTRSNIVKNNSNFLKTNNNIKYVSTKIVKCIPIICHPCSSIMK